jgi:hypothetical protein
MVEQLYIGTGSSKHFNDDIYLWRAVRVDIYVRHNHNTVLVSLFGPSMVLGKQERLQSSSFSQALIALEDALLHRMFAGVERVFDKCRGEVQQRAALDDAARVLHVHMRMRRVRNQHNKLN